MESDQEHKWYKKRDKDMKAGHDVVKKKTHNKEKSMNRSIN